MTFDKPNFKLAYTTANKILLSNAVNKFPFSIRKLVKNYPDIKLLSYGEARKIMDINAFNLGSKDGMTVPIGNPSKYWILYNEEQSSKRKRWTIAHELGHIFLNHRKVSENEDDNQEIEAHCFAAQLLMPTQAINLVKLNGYQISIEMLMSIFDVSNDAAQKRQKYLRSYVPHSEEEKEFDDILVSFFSDYIDKVVPCNKKINYFEDDYEEQKARDTWQYN